jgi:DNA end-binding protein Ku
VQFHQLEEGSGARIHNKRVSEKTGKEVPWEKIVKGYETSKGRYVTVTPEELEAFEPNSTKTIEIEDFVSLDEIDPIYYDATYYLAPAGGDGAAKAYRLLLDSMEKEQKVAIGRFVMRTKQYLAAIRPYDGVLALSTLRFADEVVPRSEIAELKGAKGTVSDRELKMASQIIDSLTTEWKPSRYHDTYRERVLELIKKKSKGQEIVADKSASAPPSNVVDLMAALEASLEKSKKPRRRTPAAKKAPTTRPKAKKAAKKTAARKSA